MLLGAAAGRPTVPKISGSCQENPEHHPFLSRRNSGISPAAI
jgi:hypothetical protein